MVISLLRWKIQPPVHMVTQQKSVIGTVLWFQILNYDTIQYHSYHLHKDFEGYCWFLAQTIYLPSLFSIHKLNSFSLKQILMERIQFSLLYRCNSQISILFVVVVCEIGSFLNTNWSDINAVNCSFLHFSDFSITPRAVSGMITFVLSLVRWSWVKGFTVMHLTNRLTSEENRWLKDSLSSWCLLLDSARMSFRS